MEHEERDRETVTLRSSAGHASTESSRTPVLVQHRGFVCQCFSLLFLCIKNLFLVYRLRGEVSVSRIRGTFVDNLEG